MRIIDVLKDENARVSTGDRWLVIEDDNSFVVYEHKYKAKKVTTLYKGKDEDTACKWLIEYY